MVECRSMFNEDVMLPKGRRNGRSMNPTRGMYGTVQNMAGLVRAAVPRKCEGFVCAFNTGGHGDVNPVTSTRDQFSAPSEGLLDEYPGPGLGHPPCCR